MITRLLIGACAILAFSSSTDSLMGQDKLPAAEKVLNTYIAKTGGLKAYKAIKNAKMSGEMTIPAAGLTGKLDIVLVMPNKFHFKLDMGSSGSQERGSNGKVMWENSTIQGARIIKGDEAEQMLQEISMGTILDPKKYYKKMETTGKETVKGDECYVLEMTKNNGKVDKDYYSIKTGLKVKSVRKVETPLGELEVASFDSNYKKSKNGLMTAWSGEQKLGPNSIMMNMKSVEFNVDLMEQKFDLPDEVKELIDE